MNFETLDSQSDGNAYSISIPLNKQLSDTLGGNALSDMIEAANPMPEYIGKDKIYSNDDPNHKRPREGYTTEVYVLNLSKEDDLKKYQELLTIAGTSLFTKIRYTERHWDESSHNWIILIELSKKVLVDPDKR